SSVSHSSARERYSSRRSLQVFSMSSSGVPRLQSELAGSQVLHDLLRATADHHDLHLTVDALAPSAAHEAHAAQDLDRLVGAELHGPSGKDLAHAGLRHELGGIADPVLQSPRQLVDMPAGGGDAHCHVHELVPDDLAADEGLTEGMTLACPFGGLVQADLGVGAG